MRNTFKTNSDKKKINRLLWWCKWKIFTLKIDFTEYEHLLR